jgi:hypothetical protein
MAPIPAPITASGMISQLAQPSKGIKAIAAQTNATIPMMSDTRLSKFPPPQLVAGL